MRRLLYVPIVHSQSDMGQVGVALEHQSAVTLGERRWRLHQETVDRFWDSVEAYLQALDARQLRIYQDGLPADGETGRRIVVEAARRGSRNYQVVLKLLERGAELRLTEDPALLWQERANLLALAQAGAAQPRDTEQYRRRRDQLTEERDKAVAEAIGASLQENELGLLFMGAYHDVLSHLAADISVHSVKDPTQLRAYFEALFGDHDDARLVALGERLASPVRAT